MTRRLIATTAAVAFVLAPTASSAALGLAVSNTIRQSILNRGYPEAVADGVVDDAQAARPGWTGSSWFESIKKLGLPWPFKLATGKGTNGGDDPNWGRPGHSSYMCEVGCLFYEDDDVTCYSAEEAPDGQAFCTEGFDGEGNPDGYGGAGADMSWDDGLGFGGGGATSAWGYDGFDCDDFNYRLDVGGNLVIPTIPLPGGGAMEPGQQIHKWTSSTPYPTGYSNIYGSDHYLSTGLLWTHFLNSRDTLAGNKDCWYGVWRITYNSGAASLKTRRGACYYMGTLTTETHEYSIGFTTAGYSVGLGNLPCPVSGSGGGDFDYYPWSPTNNIQGFSACLEYAPNFAISPSGYYYPDHTSIPFSLVDAWLTASVSSVTIGNACPISMEAIRIISDGVLERTTRTPGYEGPEYEPVKSDDVRTGPDRPMVEDMSVDPTLPEPVPETQETPDTDTDPEETVPTTYDNPPVGTPDLTPEDIDWWPDLPAIEIDLGSPACPTYELVLPQWEEPFVLDSHCPLVESNRAVIGAIMIAMFTMMSVFIVLRA